MQGWMCVSGARPGNICAVPELSVEQCCSFKNGSLGWMFSAVGNKPNMLFRMHVWCSSWFTISAVLSTGLELFGILK